MIYFILSPETNTIKIGYTAFDIKNRLTQLQTGNPIYLTVIQVINGDITKEKELHDKFAEYRQQGEWFYFGEKIRRFITELNYTYNIKNTNVDNNTKLLFNSSEKNTVKLIKIINNSGYKDNIKKDFSTNKYCLQVDENKYELFDYDKFKKYILKNYDFLPTTRQIDEILPLVSETIDNPTIKKLCDDKFKDYSAFELLLIEHVEDNYISQNKPFILNDVLTTLDVKPASYVKNASRLLKSYFGLTSPGMSVVNNKRARWWNAN